MAEEDGEGVCLDRLTWVSHISNILLIRRLNPRCRFLIALQISHDIVSVAAGLWVTSILDTARMFPT